MSFGEIAAYGITLLVVLGIGILFFKPLKSMLVLLLHSLLGGVGLYISNLLFSVFGLSIGINMVTASVCGLFGLPGLVLLLLLKVLFSYG